MERYCADALVTVYPFAQQRDGTDVIIGNSMRSSFLSIPVAALDILTNLAKGKTVGETQALHERQYGDKPGIEAFLEMLEDEGFVAVNIHGASPTSTVASFASLDSAAHLSHFAHISPEMARRICGLPALVGCGLFMGLGMALVALEPSLLPPTSVLVFPRHLTLLTVAMTALVFGGIFLHELAHLVAARAAGVPSRLGVSHRLWFLVAETDMTGIWMAPKRQRYIAFLAGPLVDAISASALVMLLWGDHHSWLSLPPMATPFTQALLLTYLFRLLWQCFFFMRTDFYFVITNVFDCKNLMVDTKNYLRNQLARMAPSIRRVDQSVIPLEEMRFVRWYSLIWLVGRAVAFGVLLLITIPLLWGYGVRVADALIGGDSTPYEVIDALVLGLTTMGIPAAGLALWIRSIYQAGKRGNYELTAD